MGAIYYDEWKPEQYLITGRYLRFIIWCFEKLTKMKVVALYREPRLNG